MSHNICHSFKQTLNERKTGTCENWQNWEISHYSKYYYGGTTGARVHLGITNLSPSFTVSKTHWSQMDENEVFSMNQVRDPSPLLRCVACHWQIKC